jgi:putative two-component system response regulator
VETIERLGRVAELRDDATGQHTYRVARLSALLAQELHLPPEEVELIMRAAPLHYVGKVAIEDEVLLKRGAFSLNELEIMREHARLGAQILSGGRSELMQMAEQIGVAHHERWDGQGYPQGLAAQEITLSARIVAVADAFDALTRARPYKEAWSVSDALLLRSSGKVVDSSISGWLRRLCASGVGEC